LAYSSKKNPAPSFGCTQVPGATDVYVCKPK